MKSGQTALVVLAMEADGETRQKIEEFVKARGCDVVLYGHTHEASVEEQDGVLLINPGCMTRFSGKQSYCYLVIVGKKAVATIVEVR